MSQTTVLSSTGSPYDDAVDNTSRKFAENRIPSVGAVYYERESQRRFRFLSTEEVFVAAERVAYNPAQVAELANLTTAVGVGNTEVTVNTTGVAFYGGSAGVVAANRLSGGYLMITDGPGEGYPYYIKSHTAGTASASITFTLIQPLKVALTATTDVHIVGNPYESVVEGDATKKSIGFAMVPTTGATSSLKKYFWAQVSGPGMGLGSGTEHTPLAAAASGAVADSAEAGSGAYDQIVGIALAGAADGHVPLWIDLE